MTDGSLRSRVSALASRASDRLPRDRTARLVLLVTAVALLARLAFLGSRIAHYDEGRVAFWTLRYADTGVFWYRPVVHGPFLYHVNDVVFTLFGANDFTMRLVVALLGGALPASAWLFREHLRDSEVVALSVVLAANPLLFYYSRFMRNDVVLAAFMLFALGFFVRTTDTGEARYLYAAVACFALGLTAKENGLLYPVVWLGAGVLLLDHRLSGMLRFGRGGHERETVEVPAEDAEPDPDDRPVDGGADRHVDAGDATPAEANGGAAVRMPTSPGWTARLIAFLRDALATLYRFRVALVVAAVEFLAIVVFFYAPRGLPVEGVPSSAPSVGLWSALGDLVLAFDPGPFVGVVQEATMGSWEELTDYWVEKGTSKSLQDYQTHLAHYLDVLIAGAWAVVALGAVGFVADRYSESGPRDLVALGAYSGAAWTLGYPYMTDIRAPWGGVHVVVFLAIPAAVALALLYRWGAEAVADDDAVSVALSVVLLVLVVGGMGVTAVDAGYLNSATQDRAFTVSDDLYFQDGEPRWLFVQYAQPYNGMKESLATVREVAAAHDGGADVLFVGKCESSGDCNYSSNWRLAVPDEGSDDLPPAASGWYDRLPLPWYTEAYGANVTSASPQTTIAQVAQDAPPVVIAYESDRNRLARFLDGYTVSEYYHRQGNVRLVIFVDESYT